MAAYVMDWFWIGIAGYIIGYVQVWRTFVYVLVRPFHNPDNFDWVMGFIIGGIVSALWPISGSALFLYNHPIGTSAIQRFARMPRKERLKEREERIRQKERELGIF